MVAALGIPAKFALRQLCASALGHDDWDEGQGQHGQPMMPDHGPCSHACWLRRSPVVLPFGCSLMPLNIHPAADVAPLDDASGAAASSSNDAADRENALTPTANGDCITTPPARAKDIRGFIPSWPGSTQYRDTSELTCTAGFSTTTNPDCNHHDLL